MDLAQLLLLWGAVVFASVLRAFTGFGFALAAVPVLSLIMSPTQAVVLSALLGLTASLLNLRSYWGVVPLRPMAPLLFMALVGTLIGAALLTVISAAQFQLWIGLSVILACLGLTFFRPTKSYYNPILGWITGLVSGLMNGALAIPGPPMIIYAMLTEPQPRRSRALLMTYFLASSLMALASYTAAGFIELKSLLYFAVAFPVLYAGDKLGYYLFRRFGDALYRRIALAGLVTVGVASVVRALL